MSYRIAAVDVHKKMLAVVVADVAGEGEYQFERRKFGATPDELHVLAQWLVRAGGRRSSHGIDRAVLEAGVGNAGAATGSRQRQTAGGSRQDVRHAAPVPSQVQPRAAGRKNDFADGERMIKRLVAQELVLSFVPDPEQRLWRTVTRRKHQLTRAKVGFQNQLESLLEQAHIKLSSFVSDLLGRQCAAHVEGSGGRGNRPGRSGGAGRLPTAGHAGTIAGRPGGLRATEWSLPSAAEDGAGGVAVDRDRTSRNWSGRRMDLMQEHQDGSATRGGSARFRGAPHCFPHCFGIEKGASWDAPFLPIVLAVRTTRSIRARPDRLRGLRAWP